MRNLGSAEKLIVSGQRGPVVEQYRKLAANLLFAKSRQNARVIMVASAVAGEGKTLTASNLALTLAGSYRFKVLLIDADLRRPSIHGVFGLPNPCGLIDDLRGAAERASTRVAVTDNLTVVTAGRPDSDPMSALTSDRMRCLITEAAAEFDWVLIDTPPIALLPDAHLLAEMTDAALLVVRAGHTPFSLISRAVEVLGASRIAGVILNRVEQREIGGGYYYYGQPDYYGATEAQR